MNFKNNGIILNILKISGWFGFLIGLVGMPIMLWTILDDSGGLKGAVFSLLFPSVPFFGGLLVLALARGIELLQEIRDGLKK